MMGKKRDFPEISYSFIGTAPKKRRGKTLKWFFGVLIIGILVFVSISYLNRTLLQENQEQQKEAEKMENEWRLRQVEKEKREMEAKRMAEEEKKRQKLEEKKREEAAKSVITDPQEKIVAQILFYSLTEDLEEQKKEYFEKFQTKFEEDYLFPSDKELISDELVEKLTEEQAFLVRNEIFARRGYIFQSGKLEKFFSLKTWYEKKTSEEIQLSEIERKNVDKIWVHERSKGWQ